MDFAGAVKAGFKNFANFRGVASRREYWWFILFNLLVGMVAATIDLVSDSTVLGNLVNFALFVPLLSLLIRRFRDTGVSPYWLLTWLIPLGTTIFLVVSNMTAIVGLANGLEQIDTNDDQAVFDYLISSTDFKSLVFPIVMILLVWALWSIFELVITLLPSRKQPEQPVAEPNYY